MAGEGQILSVAERLERTRRRMEQWRSTRRKRSAIPIPLWNEAVALTRELGISPVKRTLNLNYGALKSRAVGLKAGARKAVTGRFIELPATPWQSEPTNGVATIELAEKDGARLSVRLGSGSTLDVVRVIEAFRR